MTASNLIPASERDLVCGMNVNPGTAKHIHEHAAKKYYFCCASCLEKFKANPQSYITKPVPSGLVVLGAPFTPKASSSAHAATAHTASSSLTVSSSLIATQSAPKPAAPRYTSAPCAPRFARASPGRVPLAAWPWNLSFHSLRRERNTPARCTPKSFAGSLGRVPFVAWRSSRAASQPLRMRILSCAL